MCDFPSSDSLFRDRDMTPLGGQYKCPYQENGLLAYCGATFPEIPTKYKKKKHILGSRTHRPPTRSFKDEFCPRYPASDLIPPISTMSGKVYLKSDARDIKGTADKNSHGDKGASPSSPVPTTTKNTTKKKPKTPAPAPADDTKPKKRKRGRPSKSDKEKELAALERKKKKLKAKKKKKKAKKEGHDEDEDEEEDQTLYCYCKSKFTGAFMVGCDGPCKGWYHPRCLGYEGGREADDGTDMIILKRRNGEEDRFAKFYCVECKYHMARKSSKPSV